MYCDLPPFADPSRLALSLMQRRPVSAELAASERIHERICKGLPGRALATVKQLYGMDNRSLGRFIGVAGDKTIAKRLSAEHLPGGVESDRVWRLLRIYSEAQIAFDNDAEATRRWFRTSSVRLGGAVPLDFLGTEEGARLVSTALAAIEYGLPV